MTVPGVAVRGHVARSDGCVAAAEADASCATPLVLNIGWDACYCATDACDAPVATSYMTTYRYAGEGQGLSSLGERYQNLTWESPCQPSRAPTRSPTLSPTVGALSSSSSSSEKPGTVGVVLMVILCILFWWQCVETGCYGCSKLHSNMFEECASDTTAAPREARHTPAAPLTPHTPRTIQVFSDIDALFEEHGDHHTDEPAA